MSDRPNILLVTSDQHRGDCLGTEGHPCISTPHLDRLAFEGVRFSQAYTDCPVCIPARTTMITGRDAHANGIPAYSEKSRLKRDESLFLGSLMNDAGYQTAMIGKRHWHADDDFWAGFQYQVSEDEYHAACYVEHGRPSMQGEGMGYNEINPVMSQDPPRIHSTDWYVDRLLEYFKKKDAHKPFFAWLSVIDPHPPIRIHEPYYSMYDTAPIPEPIQADWAADDRCPLDFHKRRLWGNPSPLKPWELRKSRGVYYGMITNIDHQLGRIIGRLMQTGEWQNTWVIYTTDHGEHLGDYGGQTAKSSFLDVAARLPFIVRPPAGVEFTKGSVCKSIIGNADLLPSICAIGGATVPADVTGKSWLPLVKNPEESTQGYFHGHINGTHMYLEPPFKYIYYVEDGAELVFNMAEDPQETNDLSADTDLTARFRQKLTAHLTEEGHTHVKDGQLVNQHEERRPDAEYRAMNAAGLGATGW